MNMTKKEKILLDGMKNINNIIMQEEWSPILVGRIWDVVMDVMVKINLIATEERLKEDDLR